MKKFIFILLAIIATTINAVAYTVTDADGLVYWLDSYLGNEATLISCENKDIKSITVPSIIHFGRDVPVRHIGSNAIGSPFIDFKNLEEIILPEGIVSIQGSSFKNCIALKKFRVPKSTKAISTSCFSGCVGLKEFEVAEGNEYYATRDGVLLNKDENKIWKYPFGKESESYIIPEGVTEIAPDAFSLSYGTPKDLRFALKHIKFPSSLTQIGRYAFENAYYIESLEFTTAIKTIGESAFKECSSIKNLYLPSSITSIGLRAFNSCTALQSVIMDANIEELPVGLFEDCVNLTDCIINSPSMKTFNQDSFNNCIKLKNVKLPDSLEVLDAYVFTGCESLETISFPETLGKFHPFTFSKCRSLKQIDVQKDNQTYISVNGVVYNHEMSALIFLPPLNTEFYKLPESIVKIWDYAFYSNRQIKHVFASLPENQIKEPSIVLNCNVTEIGRGVFYNCSNLEDVTLPNSIVSMGDDTFDACTLLKTVQLSEGLTFIGQLGYMPFLECLVLPPLLSKIPSFFVNLGDKTLKSVYAPYANPIECGSSSFSPDIVGQTILYVPRGSKSKYVSSNEWKNFSEIREFDYVRASSMTIDQKEYYAAVGESITLTGSLKPDNVFFKHIQWECDEKSEYVSIGVNNGRFIGKTKGVYTVKAHPVYGSDVSDECKVYVGYSKLQSVSFNHDVISLHPGETTAVSLNIYPENAYCGGITWSTDNETVAVVDNNGVVNSKSIGVTKLRAQIVNTDIYAECEINVTAIPVLVKSLSITPDEWNGIEGETFQITAVVLPENATDKTLEWSSSNEFVATVDNSGLVSVLKEGSCIITAKTTDGSEISAECIVTSTSGIDDIFADADERFDIYNMQGVLIKKDCNRDGLKMLSSGIYILRQGRETRKLIIR